MSVVILIDQNVKSKHFLSICPSTVQSKARIIPVNAAIMRKMPFLREFPAMIFHAGTPQQFVYQGDQVFQWLAQTMKQGQGGQGGQGTLGGQGHSQGSIQGTVPSDSIQGYDVTMSGNSFAFLSDDGHSTFMADHGMLRCSSIDMSPRSISNSASSSTSASSGQEVRSSRNQDIMERFEQLRESRQ